MLRPKRKKGTVRIFTRHPSHYPLVNNILTKYKVVYRAGSTTETKTSGWIEINTIEAVKNCSNKLNMKRLFKQFNVKSPEFYTRNEIITLKEELKFPILAKKKFRSRGKGMKKINSLGELNDFLNNNSLKGYYFEKYYNYSREYRIHISSRGECFYTNRKMRSSDAEDRWFFNSSNCVWILENNPLFNKPDTWNDIIADCYNALKSLNLDIGAADVRVNKKGEWMIIEMNSAPSFGNITLEKYKEEIPKLIQIKRNK